MVETVAADMSLETLVPSVMATIGFAAVAAKEIQVEVNI